MKLVQTLLASMPVLFAAFCLGTTSVQAVALGWMWSKGKFSEDKMVRYAAVIYGLDLTEIPGQSKEDDPTNQELLTREEILDSRVHENRLLINRSEAVVKGTNSVRMLFETLRSDSDRFEQMKDRFDAHLADLEQEARAAAIEELQRTLEVLQAKQAKDLILRMLEDQGLDPSDDVLDDVVTMIKAMPTDKRRKILGEFKSEAEREQLHMILLEIGELNEPGDS